MILLTYLRNPLPKYKVFHVLLTGLDNNNPEVISVENTLGNVTIARTLEGKFHVTGTGLFTDNKTSIFFGNSFFATTGTKSIKQSGLTVDGFDIETLNSGTASDLVMEKCPMIIFVKI